MLGDAYGAAVVAALSKKELQAMDDLMEKTKEEDHLPKKSTAPKVITYIFLLLNKFELLRKIMMKNL